MRRQLSAIVLGLALVVAPGLGERRAAVMIQDGYISGAEFLDMGGIEKKFYVAGVIEGILLTPAFGAPDERLDWLYACTRRLGLAELRRGLFDYIKVRAELLDNRNPAKLYRALRATCVPEEEDTAPEPGDAQPVE